MQVANRRNPPSLRRYAIPLVLGVAFVTAAATAAAVTFTSQVEASFAPTGYAVAATIIGLTLARAATGSSLRGLALAYAGMLYAALLTGWLLGALFFPNGEYVHLGAARAIRQTLLAVLAPHFLVWPVLSTLLLPRRLPERFGYGCALAVASPIVLAFTLVVLATVNDLIRNACCR